MQCEMHACNAGCVHAELQNNVLPCKSLILLANVHAARKCVNVLRPIVCFYVYTNMPDTKHLLNRIGFGPRPGDIERIQQLGTDKYLEQQLHPDRIENHATEELLAGLPSIRM